MDHAAIKNGHSHWPLQMSQIIEDLRLINARRPDLLSRLDYLREFKQGIVTEENDDPTSHWEMISFFFSIILVEFSCIKLERFTNFEKLYYVYNLHYRSLPRNMERNHLQSSFNSSSIKKYLICLTITSHHLIVFLWFFTYNIPFKSLSESLPPKISQQFCQVTILCFLRSL